jgi:threonylcarbamoyladenosine tRNA methylthiotransferase MtaB
VNIGDYGKGEFGNKNTNTFLELVQELDKVRNRKIANFVY